VILDYGGFSSARQRYRKSNGRPTDGSKPSYEPYIKRESSQYQRARSKSPPRDRQPRAMENSSLHSHYGQVPLAASIPGAPQAAAAPSATPTNGMAAMQHMLPQTNPYAAYYYSMATAAPPPLPPTSQPNSTPVNPPLPTQPPPPLPPTPQQCMPYPYYAQYMAAAGYPYANYVPQ